MGIMALCCHSVAADFVSFLQPFRSYTGIGIECVGFEVDQGTDGDVSRLRAVILACLLCYACDHDAVNPESR